MAQEQRTTWVEVQVVGKSDQAVLLSTGRHQSWIPLSQILDQSDGLEIGADVEVEIPEWLATKAGLV